MPVGVNIALKTELCTVYFFCRIPTALHKHSYIGRRGGGRGGSERREICMYNLFSKYFHKNLNLNDTIKMEKIKLARGYTMIFTYLYEMVRTSCFPIFPR